MSRFLVINNLDFSGLIDTFDNSNNEMEYTKYILKDKKVIDYSNMNDTKFKQLRTTIEENSEKLHSKFLTKNNMEVYLSKEDDALASINVIRYFVTINSCSISTYYYDEFDGGVQEITNDTQDIYKSRFDDMHDTIMQILEESVNKNYIFEIEE